MDNWQPMETAPKVETPLKTKETRNETDRISREVPQNSGPRDTWNVIVQQRHDVSRCLP